MIQFAMSVMRGKVIRLAEGVGSADHHLKIPRKCNVTVVGEIAIQREKTICMVGWGRKKKNYNSTRLWMGVMING